MTTRRGKASVALVTTEHIAGMPVIEVGDVRECVVATVYDEAALHERAAVIYRQSPFLAAAWILAVRWMREQGGPSLWILDTKVARKGER